MRMLLKGGQVYDHGQLVAMDIEVTDGIVTGRGQAISSNADKVYDCRGLAVFPGFADVHVHLREPGFSYKETIATGSRAAAAGAGRQGALEDRRGSRSPHFRPCLEGRADRGPLRHGRPGSGLRYRHHPLHVFCYIF